MIQYDSNFILFFSPQKRHTATPYGHHILKKSSTISIIDFITIQRHWKDLYSRPLNETHWRHLHEWNTHWVCSSWHQSINTANMATFEIILFFEPEGKKWKENYILFKVNVVKIKLTISEKKIVLHLFLSRKRVRKWMFTIVFWSVAQNTQLSNPAFLIYCPDRA